MALFSLQFMACSQVNHLTPDCAHASSTNYYRHQIVTAQDFMVHSPLAFWLSGGLNLQIEHHLFPTVCHCHLRQLQPKVQALCEKHGVPYAVARSYADAYALHKQHTSDMATGSPQESHSHHDDHEGIEDPIKWVWLALGGVAVVALC
jgi:delta11-fatty-acid desaturase